MRLKLILLLHRSNEEIEEKVVWHMESSEWTRKTGEYSQENKIISSLFSCFPAVDSNVIYLA